jgi:enterobacteria phage integrase
VQTNKISREFSKIRDELHLYTNIKDRNDRPQFHDIRSLAIFLFTKQFEQENKSDSLKKAGIRAAQKSEQSTKLYIDGHEDFRVADDAVIEWRNN